MGWSILLVFLIAAIVIFGGQIIFIKIFSGEADEAISNGNAKSTKHTFCKALDKKLQYYDLPVRWLIFYINILLPAVTISAIYSFLPTDINEIVVPDAQFIAHLFFIVISCVNIILIRGIDSIAFYINFAFMAAWLTDIAITSAGPLLPIVAIFILPIAACNVVYFAKRYRLFLKSAKQLSIQNES